MPVAEGVLIAEQDVVGLRMPGDAAEVRPITPGTCLHLPPYTLHCLENSGRTEMKVLGVFHPSGDPASRA